VRRLVLEAMRLIESHLLLSDDIEQEGVAHVERVE